jgi:hypothetical protein
MLRPILVAAAAFAAAASLTAQGTTFVPHRPLMRFTAEGVPALLAMLQKSGVGKLLAEPDVAAAFQKGLQRYRHMAARREALFAFATKQELELDPWLRMRPMNVDGFHAIRTVELDDMVRLEAIATFTGDDARFPSTIVTVACKPRAEGRWTALFERHAKEFGENKYWKATPDAKFEGTPFHEFAPVAPEDVVIQGLGEVDQRVWMLHVPGLFAFGSGPLPELGKLGVADPVPPQVVGTMNLAAYVKMFGDLMGGTPPEVVALGFDTLESIRWSASFHGDKVLDEIEVKLKVDDEPRGLVGAVLNGTAALPAQPLPEKALAQIRAGIDPQLAWDALVAVGGAEGIPEAIATNVKKAFTGGVAIGVTAPARGGLIPRMYLSLGVADPKALDALLAALPPMVQKKSLTLEGTECTALTIANAPPAMQPTFCVLDGVLHCAESGQSLRAFLKARVAGGEAMDVGDAKEPEGPGEKLATFDVRWDEAAIYSAYLEVWLPLLKLLPDEIKNAALLEPGEMPEADAVLPLLGKGRGLLRRDGKTYRLQQLGTLGGVEAAAAAMTWGPILSARFHHDYYADELERAAAKHVLGKAWEAIEAFQKANQRLPNDLGELVTAQRLPVDALLLPGDALAEAVALPAGDTRVVKSSFRWFKDGVTVNDNAGNDVKVVLVAIKPFPWNRPMLSQEGTQPEVYGPISNVRIDQFGK